MYFNPMVRNDGYYSSIDPFYFITFDRQINNFHTNWWQKCEILSLNILPFWRRLPPVNHTNFLFDLFARAIITYAPVVQSIVSWTSSLRGQFVMCFTTSNQIRWHFCWKNEKTFAMQTFFIVEEMRKAFAMQKLFTFFQRKYIGVFQILTF